MNRKIIIALIIVSVIIIILLFKRYENRIVTHLVVATPDVEMKIKEIIFTTIGGINIPVDITKRKIVEPADFHKYIYSPDASNYLLIMTSDSTNMFLRVARNIRGVRFFNASPNRDLMENAYITLRSSNNKIIDRIIGGPGASVVGIDLNY